MPDFPAAPPPPAPLGMVQGNKPQKKPMTPTILGQPPTEASGVRGQATLLGQ
jgi:hypothetical protein